MFPYLLFGGTAILAGFVVILAFPETLNKKLPDTIDETKDL